MRNGTGSIDPNARCEAADVGLGSEVRAFATVAHDCVLGAGCTIGAGARILAGARIGQDVVIGENSVVRRGIGVDRGAVVEPGSIVCDPVPANAIVRGNPARIVGYVGGDIDPPPSAEILLSDSPAGHPSRVRGVTLHRLTRVDDMRGSLMAAEFGDLPFTPIRLFTVSGVTSEHIRGSHAHRECAQLLVSISGSLSVVLDDGEIREEYTLDSPAFALYTPPMIWGTQYKYSPDATLLVLASHPYDPNDYIRDYDEFLRQASETVTNTSAEPTGS